MIGAGPAGLAAGYFLARAGHPVTVFEREASAGGVVKNIIPQFRIPGELIQHDIDFVVAHGVKIEYGCDPHLSVEKLQAKGFRYVLVGTGTDKNSGVKLGGDNQNVHKSLQFLREFNRGAELNLGKRVAVVGAGNTAMDCARAALRVPGVQSATIVYRRSQQEMPAWREEYDEALLDGVDFEWLCNPEQFNADGTLVVRVMKLGEPDEKGRRRPVETDEIHPASRLSDYRHRRAAGRRSAVGNGDPARPAGLAGGQRRWRDQQTERFPDRRRSARPLFYRLRYRQRATGHGRDPGRENIASSYGNKVWNNVDPAKVYQRKGAIAVTLVDKNQREAFVEQEASRCLECNYVCSKCVDVCPNRANISVAVPGFQNRFQTLHLDAYCNECGNCAQFCPWQGKPYKDKITVFSLEQDFVNSTNPGFFVAGASVKVRQDDQTWQLEINDRGQFNEVPAQLDAMCRIISHIHQHQSYLLGGVEV